MIHEIIHGEHPPVICDLAIGPGDILYAGGFTFKVKSCDPPTHGYGGVTVYRILGEWLNGKPKSEIRRDKSPSIEFWLHGGLGNGGYVYLNSIMLAGKSSPTTIPLGRPLESQGHPLIALSPHFP